MEEKGFFAAIGRFDDNYIRPFLIYKYDRIKNEEEFEIEDVLDELKAMEDELHHIDDVTHRNLADMTKRNLTIKKGDINDEMDHSISKNI